ncbi:MAG: saccharopine dehydrogenase NADP-binding domain-containing protein [bacterium]
MVAREAKPNILILGASGGVAQAVMQILTKYRSVFSFLILLDKNDGILSSKFIKHKKLDYIFIKKEITSSNIKAVLSGLVDKYKISIVLDLTDCDTKPILSAADSLKISYLNCSLNDSSAGSMVNFSKDMKVFSKRFRENVHVLSMGMNPGIANHLIIKGVLEYGLPNDFIEIEYDSGFPENDPNTPFITWSKKQFLNEAVWEYTGYCGKDGKYIELEKDAIYTLKKTDIFLKPIKEMEKYPMGMTVSHDEVITMSRVLEVPGKFIYAIHPVSLKRLKDLSDSGLMIGEEQITYLDNVSTPLSGSDFIGVWLNYDDKRVCYYIDVEHASVQGTNATLFLVAVGVVAGLLDFIENKYLEKGVLSVFDLNNKNFLEIVSRHVPIRKYEEGYIKKP